MFVVVCVLGGVITASTPTVSQLGDTRTRATSVAAPSQLGNLSTRGLVQTGNVMIAGFILTGTDPKQVIVRRLGPTLTSFGVLDALQDPVLELHNATSLITSNADWQSAANAAQIPVTPVDYRPPVTAAGTQNFRSDAQRHARHHLRLDRSNRSSSFLRRILPSPLRLLSII